MASFFAQSARLGEKLKIPSLLVKDVIWNIYLSFLGRNASAFVTIYTLYTVCLVFHSRRPEEEPGFTQSDLISPSVLLFAAFHSVRQVKKNLCMECRNGSKLLYAAYIFLVFLSLSAIRIQ